MKCSANFNLTLSGLAAHVWGSHGPVTYFSGSL